MAFKDEKFFKSRQKCAISIQCDIAWPRTNGVFIFLESVASNILSNTCCVSLLNVSIAQSIVGDLFLSCLT